MEKLLSDGLAALGITLDAGQTRQLESYLRELLLWNEKYGLVNAAGDIIYP